MPFAQVTLDKSGNKTLTPITESTSTTAADALALADAAKTTADAALPKAGGEMTGGLSFKNLYENSMTKQLNISYIDAEGKETGFIRHYVGGENANTSYTGMESRHYRENNSQVKSIIAAWAFSDGTIYATAPTPLATAPNTAIQTKESVARDYLSKAGGEMSGNVGIRKPASINSDQLTYWAYGFYTSPDTTVGMLASSVGKGQISTYLQSKNQNGVAGSLQIIATESGDIYATCPPPRPDNYGYDIVTTKAMKDWAPMKLTQNITIYVNAETGSDTADLFAGRGFSIDKPFKSLSAAVNFARQIVSGYIISISLLTDVSIDSILYVCNPAVQEIRIQGWNAKRKISIASSAKIILNGGGLYLDALDLEADNSVAIVNVDGQNASAHLRFGANVSLNGSVTDAVVVAIWGGQIQAAFAITGNATGKRYSCTHGSRILGTGGNQNKIPGTEAGTCDASSIYA